MCRMIALRGDPDAVQAFLQSDVLPRFQQRCMRHRSGWGLAWFAGDEPRVERSGNWVVDDTTFLQKVRRVRSHLAVVHVRRATRGGVSMNNVHPFVRDPWVFAHNGTIVDEVSREIRRWLQPNMRGTTDSEAFFHLLLHYLTPGRTPVEAGREAVRWIVARSQQARLNYVLTDGTHLVAYRRGHNLYRFTMDYDGAVVDGLCSYALLPGWKTVPRNSLVCLAGEPGFPVLHRLDDLTPSSAILAA